MCKLIKQPLILVTMLCLWTSSAQAGSHWTVGSAPEIFRGEIDAGGSPATDGHLLVIAEGSLIELRAYTVDFDNEYTDATCGTFIDEGPDPRVVTWEIMSGVGGALTSAGIPANTVPLRVSNGIVVTFTAPMLNANEASRDFDISATPDDVATQNPGSLLPGETGNRNDGPGEDVTITIRIVSSADGPTTIAQTAAVSGDWSDYLTHMDTLVNLPVGMWGNGVLKLLGADRFEMEVSKAGAAAGSFNGFFIAEVQIVHPDNETMTPAGESDTSNFSTLLGNPAWQWSDIIVNSGQGFIVNLPAPEYKEVIVLGVSEYVIDSANAKDDVFYDFYAMENPASGAGDTTALDDAMNVAFMYGRHTYSFGGQDLDTPFKAKFTFTNVNTVGGHEYTHVTVDRTAE